MLQLNTKELKNFRDTLAKWHISDFDKKDESITKSKTIKSYETLIETNRTIIEKSEDATEIAKREDEISAWEQKIEDEKDRVEKHNKALDPNFKAGRDLVSDNMLKTLVDYLDNIYDDAKEDTMLQVLVDFFTTNGAKGVEKDDVRKYLRPIGRKGASAKKSLELGTHTTHEKGDKLRDAFLGGLCDDPTLMALLPTYSWTNKIEKKKKKARKVKTEDAQTTVENK